MSALFGETPPATFQPDQLEAYAEEFSSTTGPSGNGIVIIRAGEHGSLTSRTGVKPVWLPSFYKKGSYQIVDPTGAGNTFLGGFIAGWNRSKDITESSLYGNVAASFALEQIGLPVPQISGNRELWNKVDVQERLTEYKLRLACK